MTHPIPADARPGLAARRADGRPGITASGRIVFWPSGSLWIGEGRGRTERHEHHAHQIALALEGALRFRARPDDDWCDFVGAIVPSHGPHEFEIDGATVAHLFVEPESRAGRALSARFGHRGLSALPAATARAPASDLLEAWRGHADADALRAVARTAVARLAGIAEDLPAEADGDLRMARALAFIRSRIRAPLTLADAADAAALSPSRFRHLFVQQTGSSFRAYLLWLRINVAIEAAGQGASWTDAAHAAGFADSAHLSRTHRRMFGIEPTAIRRS